MADERKLRYSERKRLSEEGSLGAYSHENVPDSFRLALGHLLDLPRSTAAINWAKAIDRVCKLHFGWAAGETIATFVMKAQVEDLLDFMEIVIEASSRSYRSAGGVQSVHRQVLPDVESRINDLCERHRFGYHFDNGEANRVGSPALDVAVTGPALLVAKRPGWEQVEKSFREALHHQAGGETDDALTAAHAALEAALKAVGLTGQFGDMVKQLRNSDVVPPYLRTTPEALEALIKLVNKSNAIRSTDGDAHGKAPGAEEAPQSLTNLAIYWTGAFIVFLAENAD